MAKQYWLMKSEADVYSIDDLQADGTTYWEGVRNFQARNNMRKMRKGDAVLYYHSQQTPPGVVGIARVVKEAYPDPHQFDPKHKYFDPKSTVDEPRWDMVDIEFVEKLDRIVGLPEIKSTKSLLDMVLVRNSRLSVQPVRKAEFDLVREMGKAG